MKKILSFLGTLFIIVFVVYIYARYIEPNSLTVNYVNLNSSLISKEKGKLKILQFSDTHLSEYFDEEDLRKVVEKINEERPDLVVFTGDLIDEYNKYEEKEHIHDSWKVFNLIDAPLGKYAIYGNHDYGGGAEQVFKKIMEKSGFILLKNEKIRLEDYNINIIGIDDSIFGSYRKEEIRNLMDENSFNIILSHEPDVIDYFLENYVDLFLAGHSHGGQINLPLINSLPPLAKKYTGGIYSFNNYRQTNLYVNIGLGTSQIPLRFMATPELAVFILGNGENK